MLWVMKTRGGWEIPAVNAETIKQGRIKARDSIVISINPARASCHR